MEFSKNLTLILAFFLLSHLIPIHSSNYTCPENFQCGNLGKVKFPYSNFSHPDCGLCMLDCNAQPSPKIKLSQWSNQWFDVKTTLQSNPIKLHDPVLINLLLNRSCSTFYHSIQLPNDSPSISFTILSNVTLFICSKQGQLSNEIMEYFVGYRNYSSCEGFVIYYRNTNSSFSSTAHGSPPNNCLLTSLPMISPENSLPNDHELFQLLAADFDLEWQLADECSMCHLSQGQCQADKKRNFLCAKPQNGTRRKLSVKVIGAAIVGVLVVIVGLLGLFLCSERKLPLFCNCNSMNETDGCQNMEAILQNYGSLAPKRYYYSDVKEMTDSFRVKLGQGGDGYVYKGKLRDGSPVAIKVLKESKGNGEEFINEVASISRTSHVNIVSLLGFCFQGQKKALIYEFMPNGSLEKFIYGKNVNNGQLEWQTLYKISIGIARGLEYLHRGCKIRIVHFDIKPHNILLDEDFCPKISDFGLAKLCTKKESIFSLLGARGTIGYIAPEVVCKNIGGVSHKSDVYSYGMMVLEMVGGRKNVDVRVDHESEIYFPHWIYSRLRCGKELGLSGISNEDDNEQARKMLIVSLWCIQTDPSDRPSMTDVVDMLEGTLEELQIPPKPYLYASKVPSTRSTISIP